MFRDKTRDSQPTDESGERLLAEEEGTLWTNNEETPTACCKSFATGLLQTAALVLFFLIGALFGFDWRGDLDTMCHAHTSQYCKLVHLIFVPLTHCQISNYHKRSWDRVQPSNVQWLAFKGKHISSRCGP